MSDMNKTAREFYKTIGAATKKQKGGYDTQATVQRIEDGVCWVHIPGGVSETPAKLTIAAKVGDVVQVRVANGRAFLVGNASAPPTDNTEAIKALTMAGSAAQAAGIAWQKAEEATADAERAHEAAAIAVDNAEIAKDAALEAKADAASAKADAKTANDAANNALQNLYIAEDVAGTVRWIQEHGSYIPTADTSVIERKVYFELVGGAYVPIANPDSEANPSEIGWYELDVTDSQAEYIMAHLAVTSQGLWVLPRSGTYHLTDENNVVLTDENGDQLDALISNGYKALLGSDALTLYDGNNNKVAVYSRSVTLGKNNGWHVLITPGESEHSAGIYLIDPDGKIAQSTTASGVEFDTVRPVKIGDNTAYIIFDGAGHINIIGAAVTLGGANNVNGALRIVNASGTETGSWTHEGLKTIAGEIGGWKINENSLYKGGGYKRAGGAYFGSSGISMSDKFWVDSNGVPYCNGSALRIMSPEGTEYSQIGISFDPFVGEGGSIVDWCGVKFGQEFMYIGDLSGSTINGIELIADVVYANIATTSDRRKKKGISDISNKYIKFFNSLKPRKFRMKDGKSGRVHIGFVAQEVEEALEEAGMTTDDFAGVVINNDVHCLRYGEFIALNSCMLQMMSARIDELEARLERLEADK